MNLRQIEVFRAVMLAGSITDAARLLHVSQPGISRMLSHIELQLGLKLFERGRGRLRPTPEAQVLYEEVESVYRGVRGIETRAQALRDGNGLRLRVLCSPSAGLELVPRALHALSQRFPSARLYMETLRAREMVGQLVHHEADLAICTLPVTHPLLTAQTLGSWSMGCVFPAGHAFAQRRSVRMADLLREPLIAFSEDTPQGQLMRKAAAKAGQVPASRIEVRSGQAACALVASGAGVALVDDLTARAWQNERLGWRPIAVAQAQPVLAVRHGAMPPSGLAQAMVGSVREQLKGKDTSQP